VFSARTKTLRLGTPRLIALWVATGVAVTALDMVTPVGVGVSAAFIILVLTAIYAPWRSTAFVLAAAATVLVAIVPLFSPAPNGRLLFGVPVISRAITVVLLWITAALVVRHKTIERELAGTRARFKDAFEQTGVGLAHVGLDGSWIGANDCLARMLGYAGPDEVTATDRMQLTHPDDAAQERENMRRLRLGQATSFSLDKRCIRKDGSLMWVHETVSVVNTGKRPDPAYFLCIIQDITERKRAERHLTQLKAAVDSANDAILVVTPAIGTAPPTVDYVNAAFERMFGWPPAEVMGRGAEVLGGVTGDPSLVQALADRPSGGRLRRKLTGHARDGTEVVADWHVTDVCDDQGHIRHRIAIARDVAETHRYERALEASEQRARRQLVELETLYQTAPIGLAMFSTDLRFVRVNEYLTRMNGLSAAEHIGRTPREVVPGSAEKGEALLRRVIETREPILDIELEGEANQAPGEIRFWRQQFYPVLLDGEIEGVGAVVEDITAQRRNEEHLRLVMRELNHRVKNTLAVVQSIASQTARSSGSLADFEKALIGRIRALADTHTLLTASNWRMADLREIVRQNLRPYRAADDRRVKISGDKLELTPSASLALSMVMHELSTNAVRFGSLSAPGGTLSVDWRLLPDHGTQTLLLRWVETGGHDIAPPEHSGFGNQLVEFTVHHEFDGQVRTAYRSDGLTCEITIPWSKVAPVAPADQSTETAS